MLGSSRAEELGHGRKAGRRGFGGNAGLGQDRPVGPRQCHDELGSPGLDGPDQLLRHRVYSRPGFQIIPRSAISASTAASSPSAP